MSDRTPTTVIAFYQQQQQLQAVEMRRHGNVYELVWQRNALLADTSWAAFAEECGVRLTEGDSAKLRRGQAVVAGVSSVGAASYRLELPVVSDHQLEDMVRMQSETRLPLPLDQMELGWQRVVGTMQQTVVSVAALRRQRLATLLSHVTALQPATLMLDSEGLVTFAKIVGKDMPSDGPLLALGDHVTHLCRMESGRLSQTAILDVGRDDLWDPECNRREHTMEQFLQDLDSALTVLFGVDRKNSSIALLAGGPNDESLVDEARQRNGLTLRLCTPQMDRIHHDETLTLADIWTYRFPIGLALTALENASYKGLFHHLCLRKASAEVNKPICSTRYAALLAVVALLVLGVVTDVSYSLKERRLQELCESSNIAEVVKEKQMQKTLAQYRPDMLDLLEQIHAEEHKGIVIDGLHFERGQPVRLTVHADKPEQIYLFEQSLLSQSGIKSVTLDKQTPDKKTKKLNCTLSLHYRNFTKKLSSR